MDDGLLVIEWNHYGNKGTMKIVLDKFFPCSLSDYKKILKYIDSSWEQREKLLNQLELYFRCKITNLEADKPVLTKQYFIAKQKAADLKPILEAKQIDIAKFQNYKVLAKSKEQKKAYKEELKSKQDSLKEVKQKIREMQQKAKEDYAEFKKAEKEIEQFKNYIKIIKEQRR